MCKTGPNSCRVHGRDRQRLRRSHPASGTNTGERSGDYTSTKSTVGVAEKVGRYSHPNIYSPASLNRMHILSELTARFDMVG